MPQIPVAQNQVSPRALPQVQILRPETRVGDAFRPLTETIQRIQDEERDKADRAAFMEADTKTSQLRTKLLLDPASGARNRRGKDAMGVADEYLSEFDKQTTEIENGLSAERQKRIYRESRTRHREQLNADLSSHEGAEREKFYADTREAFEKQSRDNAITYYTDPKRIEAEIANLVSSVRQTPGLSDEEKKFAAAEKASGVYAGVIDRYLANEDAAGADKYYASIKDKVTGEALTQIENGIRVAKNRLEAKRDSDLAERRQEYRDEMADVEAALRNRVPVTSIPSESRSILLFGEERGKRMHALAKQMQEASTKVSAMDNMSTADLITLTKSYKPVSQEGAATAAELYGIVGQNANAVLTERDKDPVGYLQSKSPSVLSAYLAFNDRPSDRSRSEYLTALKAEKTRLGIIGDEILSDTEEKQIVARMTAQDDSVSMVDSMRAESVRWGADFSRIFQQVGKDLPDVAYLVPNVPEKAANMLATVSRMSDGELEKSIAKGYSMKDVKDDVSAKLTELRASFPIDGAASYAKIESGTVKLAIAYMANGMNGKNAINQAVSDSMDGHEYHNINGHTFRIPAHDPTGAPFDTNKISKGAVIALRDFNAPDRIVPGMNFAEQHRINASIRENGYWVTAPDESGLWLFSNYQPVGKPPISYTWQQLQILHTNEMVKLERDAATKRSVEFVPSGGE